MPLTRYMNRNTLSREHGRENISDHGLTAAHGYKYLSRLSGNPVDAAGMLPGSVSCMTGKELGGGVTSNRRKSKVWQYPLEKSQLMEEVSEIDLGNIQRRTRRRRQEREAQLRVSISLSGSPSAEGERPSEESVESSSEEESKSSL